MVKKTSPSPVKSSKASDGASKTFEISNELGLHARAAAQFVKTASRFHADVMIEKNEHQVNGKSIMGLLMLAAAKGSKIRVITKGDDSQEALSALGTLIESKFGEK